MDPVKKRVENQYFFCSKNIFIFRVYQHSFFELSIFTISHPLLFAARQLILSSPPSNISLSLMLNVLALGSDMSPFHVQLFSSLPQVAVILGVKLYLSPHVVIFTSWLEIHISGNRRSCCHQVPPPPQWPTTIRSSQRSSSWQLLCYYECWGRGILGRSHRGHCLKFSCL